MKNNTNKLNQLQVLRAFAFLGIFTGHCGIKDYAAWGVSIFFILSGFLMVYSYNDRPIDTNLKSSFQFAINKLIVLYPLHIITMVLQKWQYYLQGNYTLQGFFYPDSKTILNILLLQAWVPINTTYFSMNGVAWYLSTYFFIIFFFPYILKTLKSINVTSKILSISAFIYIFQILLGFVSIHIHNAFTETHNLAHWVTYICPIFRLGDFIIGCSFGYIFKNKKIKITSIKATIIEIATLLIIVASEYIYENEISYWGSNAFRYSMLYTPSSIALIFIVGLGTGYITKALTIKPLIFLGNISSYAFLIHFIAMKYIRFFYKNATGDNMNKYFLFLTSFVVTLILSAACMYIRSYFRNLKGKKESV